MFVFLAAIPLHGNGRGSSNLRGRELSSGTARTALFPFVTEVTDFSHFELIKLFHMRRRVEEDEKRDDT